VPVEDRLQLTSIDVLATALEPIGANGPGLPVGTVSSPDGAVTLMLSDIADAAAAAAALGPERWARLVRDHHVLVGQLVSRHDGIVARFEDDGFLASFASAHAGLHAALELQRTFAATRELEGLAVRVGLHTGFVIGASGSPLGRNAVLAARIAGQAAGGEVLVSSAVKRYTETDASFAFDPRGEFHFKGMHGEHEVFAVRASA
jgi:class 3 adenylate cyclase